MRQQDLAEWMNNLGFSGWSYVTVSDVERGMRSTSIDELFALAFALKAPVVKLLDPCFTGNRGQDIDLGFEHFEQWAPRDPRAFIVPSGDPWALEQGDVTYDRYRSQFERLVEDAEQGLL